MLILGCPSRNERVRCKWRHQLASIMRLRRACQSLFIELDLHSHGCPIAVQHGGTCVEGGWGKEMQWSGQDIRALKESTLKCLSEQDEATGKDLTSRALSSGDQCLMHGRCGPPRCAPGAGLSPAGLSTSAVSMPRERAISASLNRSLARGRGRRERRGLGHERRHPQTRRGGCWRWQEAGVR